MADEAIPWLPEFPEVRCDKCRTRYTIPEHKLGHGLVTGDCPKCGFQRFSTTFKDIYGTWDKLTWEVVNDG